METRTAKREAFFKSISPYIHNTTIQQMDRIAHHTKKISCLDHSMFVAYVSFILAKRFHGDIPVVIKAGMLHDLYLCDWKETQIGVFKRLILHPQMAVENAAAFNLSQHEKNIIHKHMWPVTITKFPHRRDEIIVTVADKICAIAEVSGVYWHLKSCQALRRAKICAV
ncbi:MAG: HD family phosphohydrolase [Eubacterium sp.]